MSRENDDDTSDEFGSMTKRMRHDRLAFVGLLNCNLGSGAAKESLNISQTVVVILPRAVILLKIA